MNKEKLTYLSPETETLVVRFEGVICQSNIYGNPGEPGGGFGDGGSHNL